jgi:hypothetical protein
LTRSIRFVVPAAACACALAFSGSALAAYNPSLIIANTGHALGGSAPLVIGIGQDENDDATALATIYAPLGYRVTLGQTPGTQLGTLSAVVKVAGGATRSVDNGTVKTDNPANYLSNPCSPGMHEAVWVLEFSLLGTPYRLPMYVDRVTTGPEAAYASARIQICFPSPYVPQQQGGSPAGMSLVVAAFSVGTVFRNPVARGTYAWNSLLTPFTPGTATPGLANAVQSTSLVRLPVQLALTVKRLKRGGLTYAMLTACVKEAGAGVRGLRVDFRGGRTVGTARRVASARTNARGCVSATIRVRRTMVLYGIVDVPARQAPGCRPTLGPRCSDPSVAPAFDLTSPARRVRL